MFYDLFALDGAEAEACKFEHILSPEVTDSVCTLLGHPPNSPDGKPIPRGECCSMFRQEMKPLVAPLADLCRESRRRSCSSRRSRIRVSTVFPPWA